jgi:hypothetical protein
MQVTVCPGCQHKVKLPPNTTSRAVKTMCPKCGELLSVPPMESRHPQEEHLAALGQGRTSPSPIAEARSDLKESLATTQGRGLFAVLLGLLVLCFLAASLCLPVAVSYAGLPLSGVGILLGLHATFRGMLRREREALYAAGGVALCGLALGLILTRVLAPVEQSPSDGGNQPTLLEQEKKELQ